MITLLMGMGGTHHRMAIFILVVCFSISISMHYLVINVAITTCTSFMCLITMFTGLILALFTDHCRVVVSDREVMRQYQREMIKLRQIDVMGQYLREMIKLSQIDGMS